MKRERPPNKTCQIDNQNPVSFRTDTEGRIALSCDPVWLINKATKHFDRLYLQTKHSHARIVSTFSNQEAIWLEQGQLAATQDTRLIYRPSKSSRRLARVRYCDCCGSPGRIEFRDQHNREFLQLCAPNSIAPAEWADFIQSADQAPAGTHIPQAEPLFPKIPGNTRKLPFHPTLLSSILSHLADQNVSIEATLATEETFNKRRLILEMVDFEDDVLFVRDNYTSFALELPAIHALHLAFRADSAPQLYAAGSGNSQLFLIEPSDSGYDTTTFRDLLDNLIPELM